MEALEFSVKGITNKFLAWNMPAAEADIERLENELRAAREAFQIALRDQRSVREGEVLRHDSVFGQYSGTLAEIARKLNSQQEDLGFIRDEVGAEEVCPCSAEQFRSLVSELARYPGGIADTCEDEPPELCSLPHPDRFDGITERLQDLENRVKGPVDSLIEKLVARVRAVPADTRRSLESGVAKFEARLRSLRTHRTESWLENAINDIFSGRDRAWRGRFKASQSSIEALGRLGDEVLNARVVGHEHLDIDGLIHNADLLLDRLRRRNGKGFRFRPFLSREVKTAIDLMARVRINGRPCTDGQALQMLRDWAEAARLVESLDNEWRGAESLPEEPLGYRVNRYQDACEPLEELLKLFDVAQDLSRPMRDACGGYGPAWRDEDSIRAYREAFARAEAIDDLEGTQREFADLSSSVRNAVSGAAQRPDVQALCAAISARDAGAYRRAYLQLESARVEWERRSSAAQALRTLSQVAPALTAELQEQPGDPKWQRLAERWSEAWEWAKARTWVAATAAWDAAERTAERLSQEQKRIQDLISELASVKAWVHCFSRLNEAQRVALHAWANQVRLIGKGKGRYASQHRRAAREHLAQCQPAIPAWIMPTYRVAESVRPGQTRFDVAIIDEASQSGPEALALLFLADKILVVGDDKQISPDPFTRVEDVNRLRRDFLFDLPAADILDPEISLFDLAKTRYPARVRLVEHFRCMPEIIQFSNDLCYQDEPLVPLRQFGAGRLEPVVNAVYVQKGYTRGRQQKVNPPEATAIARKIAELVRDNRYDGKSFGVISLLGSKQAQQVETELLSLIDARELSSRSLICGDAYDFQGDERDVMFLSMVVAPSPDAPIRALSDPKGRDQRRYNVAMSRARDQVWLFHSATLNDLNPADLRSRLLRYCQNPTRTAQTVGGVDVEELARQARTADRAADPAPGKFGSWFEVDVFLRLAAKGYLVVPQYEVGGYYIDMAVIGHRSKLAVECDGERWHGPEQCERDAARQRDLERCGWPFYRLRESKFYLDPTDAPSPLFEELARHGIHPQGQDITPAPHLHVDATAAGGPLTDRTADEILLPAQSTCEADDLPGAESDLPEYVEWEPHAVPNPREASRESVIRALVEIVEVEGPATWRRIFDRYRVGLGMGRLKGPTRTALEAAARRADETGRLSVWSESGSGDWYDYLVHLPDSEHVRVRQRGPRDLRDVPCSEIAELMRLKDLLDADEEWAFRQVLAAYGLRRLTDGAKVQLRAAASMLRGLTPSG